MASHKFGIMNLSPELNERYDYYEPEKYDCISINDDYIEPLLEKLACIECYWHTLERPERGLAYCGINLIPPSSMEQFIECLEGKVGTAELIKLLSKAKEEEKFVIHFGI